MAEGQLYDQDAYPVEVLITARVADPKIVLSKAV